VRIGTADVFMYVAGAQQYALEHYELTPEHIVSRLRKVYRKTVAAGSKTLT
jgi:hypothetical protein